MMKFGSVVNREQIAPHPNAVNNNENQEKGQMDRDSSGWL